MQKREAQEVVESLDSRFEPVRELLADLVDRVYAGGAGDGSAGGATARKASTRKASTRGAAAGRSGSRKK